MLEEYDIDKLNPRPNPYAKELKKQVTIKIAPSVIDYFKDEATKTGIPYQTLINLYLADCAENKRSFTDNRSYDRRSELPAAVMIKITILNNEIDSFDKLFMLEIHTGSHNCCFHIFDLLSGFSISNLKIPSSIPVV